MVGNRLSGNGAPRVDRSATYDPIFTTRTGASPVCRGSFLASPGLIHDRGKRFMPPSVTLCPHSTDSFTGSK